MTTTGQDLHNNPQRSVKWKLNSRHGADGSFKQPTGPSHAAKLRSGKKAPLFKLKRSPALVALAVGSTGARQAASS